MAKENINLISKKCKEDWLLQSFYVQAMPDFFFFLQFSIMVESIARKPCSKHKRECHINGDYIAWKKTEFF